MEVNKTVIDIERAEQLSSLLRNIVLILGTVIAAVVFVADKIGDPLPVYVWTMYMDNQPVSISYADTFSVTKSGIYSGRLGTVTDISLSNNTNLPVSLEVRIPGIDDESVEGGTTLHNWPLFTVVHVEPVCNLTKDEIQITNNGLLTQGVTGAVVVRKFPPGCQLSIELVSTQISKVIRFMSGSIQVFYDGKRANVVRARRIYGPMRDYFALIDVNGWLGILFFVAVPIVAFAVACVFTVKLLTKYAASATVRVTTTAIALPTESVHPRTDQRPS